MGGLDLGLEAAGFETLGCIEFDGDARDALAANRPDWKLLEPQDVVAAGETLKPEDLGLKCRELTLIAGGPPCQPFSKAAQWAAPKAGVSDSRGTAVGGMLKLVASFLPEAILMENVAGFLTGANNATAIIDGAFEEINAKHGTRYKLQSSVVDAADFGVPQHRRRAIVIAFREGIPAGVDLVKTHDGDHRTAWDAIGEIAVKQAPPPSGQYASLLPSIPEGWNYQYLTARGGGPDLELFGYRTRFWSFLLKLAKNKPAWTLPASPGPSTGPFHWDNRPLTSVERLLLQGFPPDWQLASNERVNVRLAGNATPPPLAESVGRYISHKLKAPDSQPTADQVRATLSIAKRATEPPPALPPAPLPLEWIAKVRERRAHPGAGKGPAGHPSPESAV